MSTGAAVFGARHLVRAGSPRVSPASVAALTGVSVRLYVALTELAVSATAWMTTPPPAAMVSVTIACTCALLPRPGAVAQADEETGAVAGFCGFFERAASIVPRRAREEGRRSR